MQRFVHFTARDLKCVFISVVCTHYDYIILLLRHGYLRFSVEALGYKREDVLSFSDKENNMPLHCAVNSGDLKVHIIHFTCITMTSLPNKINVFICNVSIVHIAIVPYRMYWHWQHLTLANLHNA